MDQEELQNRYYELQMIMQQEKQIEEHLQKIDQQLLEIDYIKSSLDEMKETKVGTGILAPLSSGIFVKAKLEKSDEFLVNVGGNVIVKKNAEETKALMDEQIAQMKDARAEFSMQLRELENKSSKIQKEFQEME